MVLYINGKMLLQLDQLLTNDECISIIEQLNSDGLWKHTDRGNAVYERIEWDSPVWAECIRERINGALPEELRSHAVNTRIRFSKYLEDGYFDIHQDRPDQDRCGRRTMYTINCFLNNEFNGGETQFFDDNKQPVFTAVPAPGRCAIFDQRIWHRGNRVSNGFKYLMRTDIME